MFIKNYSTVDLKINIKDYKIVLVKGATTYVDENIVTLVQIKNMFGNLVEEITDTAITNLIPKTYLKSTQTQVSLGRLYKVQLGRYSVANELKSIFVNSGSVNIYVYDGATKPTALTGMVLTTSNTNVSGKTPLTTVPTYIALTQNSGTSTEIILTGVEVLVNIGAIS